MIFLSIFDKTLTVKKLFFLTVLCGILSFLRAHSIPRFVYDKVVDESRFLSYKVNVSIDYGQVKLLLNKVEIISLLDVAAVSEGKLWN